MEKAAADCGSSASAVYDTVFLWVNPGKQLSLMQLLAHSPKQGGRIRRVKMRDLVGWDKDTPIGKINAEQGIYPLLPIIQPSPQKQGCTRHNGYLGMQMSSLWTPPLSPSYPSLFLPSTMSHGMGISLWSFDASCPGCVPSQLLKHPQPTLWWGKKQKRPWGCASTAQQ